MRISGSGRRSALSPTTSSGCVFARCTGGHVSEVTLGYDPDQDLYVRFDYALADGRTDTVIDVTAAAVREAKKVDFDWTEVMLLGNSEAQDTAARPLRQGPT